jgi:predicted O-methyltransferase YrrM
MNLFRARLVIHGFTHPRSAITFLRESHRLRKGSNFDGERAREFKRTSEPALHTLLSLFEGSRVYQHAVRATQLYNNAARRVFEAYGFSGKGHKPSIITVEDAVVIYCVVREVRPLVMIETGVSDGMSSLLILEAMRENAKGTLFSIDLPEVGLPALYGLAHGWLVPSDARARWRLILENSSTALPRVLRDVGHLDIFLHDSEHSYEAMMREFNQVLCPPHGVKYVLSDDCDANAAYMDTAKLHHREFEECHTVSGFGILRRVENPDYADAAEYRSPSTVPRQRDSAAH